MKMVLIISILYFFLSVFEATPNPSCPSGYIFLNDNYCVKLFTEKKLLQDAADHCLAQDAHLVSVYNAIDNRRLAMMASNLTTPVWIGLYCTSPVSAKNCHWDDADGVEYSGEYQNFAPGNPSVPEPISMVPFGKNAGKWYSADADHTMIPFFCQKPTINNCPFNYGDYCYTPHEEGADLSMARKICQAACGDIISIHSKEENEFVLSVTMDTSNNYMLLGANGKSWLDGTFWNYDNFGFFDADIGNNIGMAISGDAEVRIGEWQSLDQEAFLAFMCKTKMGVKCGESTLAPTVSSLMCDESKFLTGNGTIYSPNYPYSYTLAQETCSYTIIAHQNYHPFVEFSEFMLDPNATITIYEYPENNHAPISILTSENVPIGRITSRTTLLWMEFSRPGTGISIDYEWKASYGYVADS